MPNSNGNKKKLHHPFVPRRLRTDAFMVWLKRLHGWIGMWGAIVGIIIGITGITLNHRATISANQANEIQQFELLVPEIGFSNIAEFDAFVSGSFDLGVDGVERTGRHAAEPGAYGLRYQTARVRIDATFVPGNRYLSAIRTDFGVLSTMNALHLGSRSGLIWVLVLDAFAGSLIFLAVTGILLWSRLHGPPLLALGLILTFLSGAAYFALCI